MQDTRDLVDKCYGRHQLELVRPSLQSLFERQLYARYHFSEARSLLGGYVGKHLADASLIEVVFGQSEDANYEFNLFLVHAGAHITACIQSLHATADILAYAVYLALGINLAGNPLRERSISIGSVRERLRSEQQYATFSTLLTEYQTGGQFKHLAALANRSKHRSVVRPSLNEDLTGTAPSRHTLRLASFWHDAEQYPEVAVESFLQAEYDRCSPLVVQAGNALNAFLSARAS